MIGRLLCRLGRHDWQLSSVQSRSGGFTRSPDRWELGEMRWVGSVYRCRRCPARRMERSA